MNHKYNLNTGPFGLCSGYWDEESHVFRRADETDQRDCCVKTCKPFIDQCVNMCPKAEVKYQKLCYETCNDIRESCINFCELSNPVWGSKNPIFEGTKEKGCGDNVYEQLNVECVKNNKNDIIDICRQQCTNSDTLDCDKHCQYSYNIITDEKTDPLYFTRTLKSIRQNVNGNGNDNSVMYIIYTLIISSIVVGIWILISFM